MKKIKKVAVAAFLMILLVLSGCGNGFERRQDEVVESLSVIYNDEGKMVEIDFIQGTRKLSQLGENQQSEAEAFKIADDFEQFVFDEIIGNDDYSSQKSQASKILWRITVKTNLDEYISYSTEEYPDFWEQLTGYLGIN